MALALKVPVFFVVTKVDICPGHVLQHSLATLSSILRKPGIKKKPYMVSGICEHHASASKELSEIHAAEVQEIDVSQDMLLLYMPCKCCEVRSVSPCPGQEQGGRPDMCPSHTHRLPGASVPDLLCHWRRPGACQALLQPAATEAQVGRQGAWQACLGCHMNKIIRGNLIPHISRCTCGERCVCMPQVDEAVEFIIDETFQVAGTSYLDWTP